MSCSSSLAPSYASTVNSSSLNGLPRYSTSISYSNYKPVEFVSGSSSSTPPPPPYDVTQYDQATIKKFASSSHSHSHSHPHSRPRVADFLDVSGYDVIVKSLVVGDSGVGKSALVTRFASNKFHGTDQYLTTIGVDFEVRTVAIGNQIVKMQIWDTAGQERFRTITSSYYRGAHIILLVLDVTDQTSYDNCYNWIKEVRRHVRADARIMLIANKCDLIKKRVISTERIQQLCEDLGKESLGGTGEALEFVETSAQSNWNVAEAFLRINERWVKENSQRLAENDEAVKQGQKTNRIFDSISIKPDSWKCCVIQ